MFRFDTAAEYDLVHDSVRDSILYWKKMRQDAQGKICLQVSGEQTHYSVEECEAKMDEYLALLEKIHATPHYEWDGVASYVLV